MSKSLLVTLRVTSRDWDGYAESTCVVGRPRAKLSNVVPRRRFENGSSGMNIRIRAEEMCCD